MTIGVLSGIYLGLFIFGIGYNALVAWIEQRGYHYGYTALLVVGGVLLTLAGVAVIDPQMALITLGAFGASGTPMILGATWRAVKQREQAIEALRSEAHDDAG